MCIRDRYTLDLTVAIAPAGTYVLKLQASGVRDLAGLQLDVNAEATFVVEARPWRNGADPLNVDNVDGIVGLDALLVVNEINNRLFSDPVTGAILIPAPTAQFPFFLDTNGDGFITGIDALLIFNWLNTHPLPSPEGEGELSSSAQEHLVGAPASTGCDAALLAFLEDTPRSLRRRR